MKPRVLFITDVPGWSIDNYIYRLEPYLTNIKVEKYYIVPSLESIGQAFKCFKAPLPKADIYYFGSWWWYWEYIKSGQEPLKNVLIDVVDDYSWQLNPVEWESTYSRATVLLTQSLECLHQYPLAVFHPFPAEEKYFEPPLKSKLNLNGRNLVVGMIAGSFSHTGEDHKGVGLVKAVTDSMPGVDLLIAGIDKRCSFKDLIKFYKEIDVFVCCSKSEGFSSSTVNASAIGVPIISTPVSPAEPFIGELGYWSLPDRKYGDKDIIDSLTFWFNSFGDESLTLFNKICHTRNVAGKWRAKLIAEKIERVIKGVI